jgi:hypothetical protein
MYMPREIQARVLLGSALSPTLYRYLQNIGADLALLSQ